MAIAALYDIHGNLPALEAVLADLAMSGVDAIVVGGDVLPGPMPAQCLDLLLNLAAPVRFIHGNGDREVLERMRGRETDVVPAPFRDVLRWTAQSLSPSHADVLAEWRATLRLPVDGIGPVLFCHATPRNDTDIFTRETPAERLTSLFDVPGVPLVVCGHTHMQFDRMIGRTRVVNAGSVGMPFGAPGAYWLLLDRDVELKRTAYDLDRAAQRIRATSYPQAEQFASGNLLVPPSESSMLAAFSRAALK
jgi:predicted phosphodiesterase